MVKYIFICCPGHSGSTLLDLLMGSHSKIESLGEISHLSKNIALNTECSCGNAIKSCPFWLEVIKQLSEEIGSDIISEPYSFNLGQPNAVDVIDYSHQTKLFLIHRKIMRSLVYLEQRHGKNILPIVKRLFNESISNNVLLYDVVLKFHDVDMVIDSSKDYMKAVAVYNRFPESTRIIVLSRDGRGVLYSRIKRNIHRKAGVDSWKNYYSRGLPILARNINEQHLLYVHYENLARDPDETLNGISAFLGISFERSMLDYSSHIHHITNGNNMRFVKSSQISLDTSWHVGLSDDNKNYFEKRAGVLNRKLGYLS